MRRLFGSLHNQKGGAGVWIALAMVLVVIFIGVAFLKSPSQKTTSTDGQAQSPPSKNSLVISIASSNTKQDWLHQAVEKFNAAKNEVDGRPIFVEIIQETIDGKQVDYRSGTMVSHILSGKIKPTIASPGEESWIVRLKKEWKIQQNSTLIKSDSPILVRTPLVVAMWQSRARALGGWPEAGSSCAWIKIRTLAASPNGWAAFGHPEWGKPKLGYGYFGESNSGTLGVISMCLIGSGKKNLSVSDISETSPGGLFIADVEKAKVHSGKSDVWLLERMIKGGPEYLDGVVTYESNVILMNRKFGQEMREPLVSFYPQDGTVVVGHPFAILDGAPWVTTEQVAAANIFCKFLLSKEQQEAVLALGLRPADKGVKLESPIEALFGANPNAKLNELSLPDQIVIDRIGEVWHKIKKHAIIALVFDKSGSMSGSKMNAAIKGAEAFVHFIDLQDRLLWMPFDTTSYGVVKQGLKKEIGEGLIQNYITTMSAGGDTALYDTTMVAYQEISNLRKKYGDAYRYGIVILSDGKDTSSRSDLTQLEEKLRPSEGDPMGIQIHTIAIGSDADEKILKKIASMAHGKFSKGNSPADMVRIYSDIATHY